MYRRLTELWVFDIVGSGGFVEGCQLAYKEGALAGDCHGLTSADNFEKWGKE
jgi:hypothetical protein